MSRGPYDPDYAPILRGDPCCYCGVTTQIEMDHIVPYALGGGEGWENLTAACKRCNQSKNGRNLLWFLFERSRAGTRYSQPMKGVRWRSDIRRWDARAYGTGRTVLLGSFLTAEAACLAVAEWHARNPEAMSPLGAGLHAGPGV